MISIPNNPNTQQLVKAYTDGFLGCYVDDPAMREDYRRIARYARDRCLAESEMPRVEDFAQSIERIGKEKCAFPWHFYMKQDPEALKGKQLTGDCTSWGTRDAVDIERCCAIAAGELESYVCQSATCLVYGARGSRGKGMAVSTAARSMRSNGVAVEKIYLDGKYDLREYNDYYQLGMTWGGRGIPEDLLAETRKNVVKTISSVNTMEAVQDLLQTGRAVAVGSMIGVSNVGNPVSRLKGSWSHCMAIVGYDARPEITEEFGSPLYFWDNSWGPWNKLTNLKPEWGELGEGMFILNESDTWRAVRGGDCWTFTDTEGFPARELHWLLI
jgi:hypothetical protein